MKPFLLILPTTPSHSLLSSVPLLMVAASPRRDKPRHDIFITEEPDNSLRYAPTSLAYMPLRQRVSSSNKKDRK